MKYVLVADDEIINQSVFEEMLCDSYEVKIVANGQECLDAIAERQPDLLLLDVAMPVLDGLEVCKRLRAEQKTSTLPIIMVSAYASNADREKGLSAGANQYISKPFDVIQVSQLVKNTIGK
ncbi:MAG: response regulator [Gammaproteobacteria bacterium]|nr:response regulator [Gammaproteobacteria bacterium]